MTSAAVTYAGAAPRPALKRSIWVDSARGVGIVLVVFGHVIDGMVTAHLLPTTWWVPHYFIYSFHMPLFFVLSGLFVKARIERDTPGFISSSVTRIAWPYLLWSIVQLAAAAAMSAYINHPAEISVGRVTALLWDPLSPFWFLQTLFLLHLAAAAILPRLGAGALLAAAIALRVAIEIFGGQTWAPIPSNLANFGIYYALGVAAWPRLSRLDSTAAVRAALMGAACLVVWFATTDGLLLGHVLRSSALAIPAALLGTFAAISLLAALPQRVAEPIAALGRASMAILVLHVLFAAGGRVILTHLFGIENGVEVLVLATALGIGGPLAVRWAARRAGAERVLGLS